MSYSNFIGQIEKLIVEERTWRNSPNLIRFKELEEKKKEFLKCARSYLKTLTTSQFHDDSGSLCYDLLKRWRHIVDAFEKEDISRLYLKQKQLFLKRKYLNEYGKTQFNINNRSLDHVLNDYYIKLFEDDEFANQQSSEQQPDDQKVADQKLLSDFCKNVFGKDIDSGQTNDNQKIINSKADEHKIDEESIGKQKMNKPESLLRVSKMGPKWKKVSSQIITPSKTKRKSKLFLVSNFFNLIFYLN